MPDVSNAPAALAAVEAIAAELAALIENLDAAGYLIGTARDVLDPVQAWAEETRVELQPLIDHSAASTHDAAAPYQESGSVTALTVAALTAAQNRTDGAAVVANLRRPQLVDVARKLDVNVGRRTVAQLRAALVDSTVGVRENSTAIRGEQTAPPEKPGRGKTWGVDKEGRAWCATCHGTLFEPCPHDKFETIVEDDGTTFQMCWWCDQEKDVAEKQRTISCRTCDS